MKSNIAVKTIAIAVAAIFAVLSAPSNAQGYGGIRYAGLDTKFQMTGLEWSTPALMVNVGYQFNPYFALEGRVGFGIGDDTQPGIIIATGQAVQVFAEVDNYRGVFMRFSLPADESVYPYFQMGHGKSKLDFAVVGGGSIVTASGDESDTAYGIGVNMVFVDNIAVNIEYMNYYDDSGIELSGVSFGLQFQF